MNVKLITKALQTLSLLSEEDVATVMNLRALSEDERELLITVLEPEKTAGKRASKKSSKGGSKSPRASGMAAAINRSLSQGRQGKTSGACTYVVDGDPTGMECGASEDNPIHDPTMGYGGYHEFDAGKSSTSAAQPARGRSSTNGGAGSGAVNSEIEKENASNVHHAGG